jgi:hypothetical protein
MIDIRAQKQKLVAENNWTNFLVDQKIFCFFSYNTAAFDQCSHSLKREKEILMDPIRLQAQQNLLEFMRVEEN